MDSTRIVVFLATVAAAGYVFVQYLVQYYAYLTFRHEADMIPIRRREARQKRTREMGAKREAEMARLGERAAALEGARSRAS